MTSLFEAKIPDLIEMLMRFPACAYPMMCGDRGIEDLRIMSPVDPDNKEGPWQYYRLDADNSELPWLLKSAPK